jgi:protein-tyrosine phosphatase
MASGQCKDIQRMELVNESQSQWDRVMFKADWYRQQLNRPDMQYLEIPAEDHPRYNISKDFSTCFEFIEQVGRKKSGGILVHCIQGLNRSAAVVVAYLVGQKKLSLVEAVEMVASKRPGVLTNRGFLKQLLSFEESLYQGPLLPELEPAERNIFTVENIVEKI